jgi:hypothetical protein
MHRSVHHTPKKRNFRTVLFSFLLLVFLICTIGLLLFGDKGLPQGRYIVAVLGDPLEVSMFDPSSNHWTTLEMSSETHVSGVQGLGDYRLDALWDVAATQSSPSAVVMETLTHEFGIPITRYIAHKGNVWQKRTNTENSVLFDIFSVWHFGSFLGHRYETNIPIAEFIGISRKILGLSPESVTRFRLTNGNGLTKKQAPDGSEYIQFDQRQFDQMTGDAYEDRAIRQEGFRVAVFNTTKKAFLGSEAARILSRLGTNVVLVGNEKSPVDQCHMSGTKTMLSSYTASVISSLFHCMGEVSSEEGQADLIVRLGTEYAAKFFISK